MKTKLSVFLCHSSGDKPRVRSLYSRLRSDGISPWLDEEDLRPGENWQTAISKAVKNADVVLVCLSKTSIAKTGFVQKEIAFALDRAQEQPEGQIYIIPVRLEPCAVPERLSQWHWVDLFADRGYEKLVGSLNLSQGHDASSDVTTIPCWLLVAEIRKTTELSERMSFEDLEELLEAWRFSCKEIIENQHGVINKYVGLGFLAYWPETSTSPEEIAAVISALKELQLQRKERPGFRLAVHFGSVAVRGVPSMGEVSLMGENVQLIWRMEGLARSLGETFCASEAAHTKLRGLIAAQPLGEFEFKGFEGKFAFFALASEEQTPPRKYPDLPIIEESMLAMMIGETEGIREELIHDSLQRKGVKITFEKVKYILRTSLEKKGFATYDPEEATYGTGHTWFIMDRGTEYFAERNKL